MLLKHHKNLDLEGDQFKQDTRVTHTSLHMELQHDYIHIKSNTLDLQVKIKYHDLRNTFTTHHPQSIRNIHILRNNITLNPGVFSLAARGG